MQKQRVSLPQQVAALRSISTVSVAAKALTIVLAATALYCQELRMIFSNALVDDSSMYILIVPLRSPTCARCE